LTNKKPPAKLNSEEGVKPITLEEGGKKGKHRYVCVNLFLN
jgi:hypothetical protein